MWPKRSEVMAPLSSMTSSKVKWQWTDVHQKAFDEVKRIITKETLLMYPDFNKPFDIHTDASKTQLGAVISQNGKPVAFYSRKLNQAQIRYTTTERELLAIIETLKEFRNILLGQEINIYTDHKNLTYKTFNTERVMRWRLILEEYSPKFYHIDGPKNIVADALSRLDMGANENESQSSMMSPQLIAEVYKNNEKFDSNVYPLKFKDIAKRQQQDKELLKIAMNNKEYHLKTYKVAGKEIPLLCHQNKIVIPKAIQKQVAQWYHVQLCHPGETRTEQTIRANFTWKGLRETVHGICAKCHTCQLTKKSSKKYGHLPEKEAEATPWEKLCVDLIGPYTMKVIEEDKSIKKLTLWAVTMIDPATGWFEAKHIPDKEPGTVANAVEQAWLTRYPWPSVIVYDNGSEFLREFADMIKDDYGIEKKGTTVRNPQANSILERIHQTLGNILRTFELHKSEMNIGDPWDGVLAAAMFALRATYHTTLKATPSQLVFGRDAITNIMFEANWEEIKKQKQKRIHENNKKENSKRIEHEYKPNEKVLYQKTSMSKYKHNPWEGPYKIHSVYDNGTVLIQKGAYLERVNIRLIKPYKE